MSSDYGLTATGFLPKTFAVVRDEIAVELRGVFGASLDTESTGALGQLIDVFAERETLLWELVDAVVSGGNVDTATGALLDALTVLTGTPRNAATKSATTLTLTGTPTTIVASGSKAAVAVSGELFSTSAAATIAASTAWAGTTAYALAARVTNAARVYVCTVAGTSAGAGGPTTTASSIADGTVTWRYLGEGTGDIDIAAVADIAGPTVALSGVLTDINTPVSGWDSVINILDAIVGTAVETDQALRDRHDAELSNAGVTTSDALRAALAAVTNVTAVKLFVNDGDVAALFEGVSVPAHAVEALVEGGTDQSIWDALLANVAAGIQTSGTTIGTALDSESNVIAVSFTRPSAVSIYVDVTVAYDATKYPSDGDTQVAAAIVAAGDALGLGYDAVASKIVSWCFKVAGVLDVSVIAISTAPGPILPTTIAITKRQWADYDTSRINVTSAAATP